MELRQIEGSAVLPAKIPWAYLECSFDYSTHSNQASVTRYPAIFIFVGPDDLHSADSPLMKAYELARQLVDNFEPFSRSQIIIVISRERKRSRPDIMESLARCLVKSHVNCVEVSTADGGAGYILQCASAVLESRKRKFPSRFKTEGERCQTVPRRQENQQLITWISQLMQVPGVSEEVAKVIAKRHSSPAALLAAVNGNPPAKQEFLADLEVPIRGQKSSRRLGPVLSRRLHSLFSASVQEGEVLV